MKKTQEKLITFDAAGRKPGRLAVEIADTLRGKNTPAFAPHKNPGIKVEVLNTDKLDIDPKKAEQKTYYRYSGYPGGVYSKSLGKLMQEDSRKVVHHAVRGMLPKNKLSRQLLKNLTLYKEEK